MTVYDGSSYVEEMIESEIPQQQEETFLNVHNILQEAVLTTRNENAKTGFTFRIDGQILTDAHDICERHGTALSTFLRECCRALVNDYKPE